MSRLRRLLNPETKQQQLLRMKLPPEQAMSACRGAVSDFGWAAVEGPPGSGRLKVDEDFTKLCCGAYPVVLQIELQPQSDGGTSVAMEGTVPGVGARSSSHLSNRMRAFALALARRNAA
jgi:hypothetical protein